MSTLIEELRSGKWTQSAQETEAVAELFAAIVPDDCVIAFHGDLGVGKTTFIRGLARHWKIKESVTSPTFNLYSIYQGNRQLIHLDAYRLSSPADLDTLMLEDFLSTPWCLAIEWPERIAESIPEDAWHLELSITKQRTHHIKLVRPTA